MGSGNALGEFLKARRDQVRPADVGLVEGHRRRVPGLRREELAALAGISSDYYLRIEQGRTNNPSPQVLGALAKALRLDDTSTAHLYVLAGSTAPTTHVNTERLASGLAALVDQLTAPAFIAGRYLDCLASNALARRLSPNFAPGRNLVRQLFLDPAEHRLHLDWDQATAGVVGGLRQVAGADPADRRLVALVDELSTSSERFRTLWARADVGFRPAGESHLHHPAAGELRLRRQRFDIPDSDGQHLHVYYASPGSESAEKLSQLQAIATHSSQSPASSTSPVDCPGLSDGKSTPVPDDWLCFGFSRCGNAAVMAQPSSLGLAVRMAELARTLARERKLDAVLAEVTSAAVELIPGVHTAGILLVKGRGGFESLATTSDLPHQLDILQMTFNEGPCVQAALADTIVSTNDFRAESRWPQYSPAVVEVGVLSGLSFKLYTGDRSAGALNLFGFQPREWDADAESVGTVLAAHAAAAIVATQQEQQLQAALLTRDRIGQAKGMIMERFGVDSVRAFELLRQLSQEENIKLAEIAERVISTRPTPD